MKNNTQNQKAAQFTEELNNLLAKYQYKLVPQLEFTKSGIVPSMALADVIPPKEPAIPEVSVEPKQPEGKEEK